MPRPCRHLGGGGDRFCPEVWRFDVRKNGAIRRCLLVRACRGAFVGFNASPTSCPQHQSRPNRYGAIEGVEHIQPSALLLTMCMHRSQSACGSLQLPLAFDQQGSASPERHAPSATTRRP
jgi:hypothetical protein